VPDGGRETLQFAFGKDYNLAAFSLQSPSIAEVESMADLYFEEAETGTTCKAGPYLVSKEEIIQFAKQYDPVPRHVDEEAAARSIFGGLTACSAHTFSIFILLTTRLQPRLRVLAGMGWDELRLPNPVRPADELDLEMIVLEKRESKSKADRGVARNQIRLRNQRSEIVLQCIANVLVARRGST
jgi:acyl dehydratase